MLEDLQEESANQGLLLHPDKTKVLTNAPTSTTKLKIKSDYIDILSREESLKYLGRRLSMVGLHETELSKRIQAAWATFTRHREELTNKKYALSSRLRLFNATVGATALYGSESWTLKIDQQRRLRTTQRKMLRAILGAKRRVLSAGSEASSEEVNMEAEDLQRPDTDAEELEPWKDFIKRATDSVEDRLQATG